MSRRLLLVMLVIAWSMPLLSQDANRDMVVAAVNGQVEAVKSLLAKGVSPDANFEELRPLFAAAAEGQLEIVRLLVAAGADPNLPPPNIDMSPLMAAALGGHRDVVAVLLENKPDLERRDKKTGATALLIAAMADHVEVVRLLLRAGANPAARLGLDGRTASELTKSTDVKNLVAAAAASAPPAPSFIQPIGGLRAALIDALGSAEIKCAFRPL